MRNLLRNRSSLYKGLSEKCLANNRLWSPSRSLLMYLRL
uniref:Uncharacterized protein n=1 Tax=Arundo donax TaxID=35708 RepID=A0A0A9BVT8_ARUDO